MEDQPKPPHYVVAIRVQFDDDQGPPELFQIRGRGTQIECHVMAERIPDFVYNGARKIRNVSVIVVPAPDMVGDVITPEVIK